MGNGFNSPLIFEHGVQLTPEWKPEPLDPAKLKLLTVTLMPSGKTLGQKVSNCRNSKGADKEKPLEAGRRRRQAKVRQREWNQNSS